jgi:quercetin dioxygenase-like cupin family protein
LLVHQGEDNDPLALENPMGSRTPLILASLTLIACGPSDQEPPPPAAGVEEVAAPATAPQQARTLFENPSIRVLEFSLEPGEALPTHEGQRRVVYSLSNYQIRFTEGGTAEETTWQEGDVHWHGADDHAVENIGATAARFLVVARTDAGLTGEPPAGALQDAASADPDHGELLLDNQDARVVRVILAPGEAQPLHQGLPRLVYSLTPYSIRYTEVGQDPVERSFQAGDAHWHEAGEHAVENTGATEARYVVFQFRR